MDKVQLLDDIAKSFSTSELAELCMSLKVEYEDLGSGGKRSQARELIGYMERRGRLPELAQALVNKRPQLTQTYQIVPKQPEDMPSLDVPQPVEAVPPVAVENIQAAKPQSTNPYSAGRMVTDTAMFFGRENERRRLRARLQTMSSCSIVGMRRVGKSSLMYYLSHFEPDFQDGQYIFAYLDLQDARYHTLAGLLSGVVTQWGKKANISSIAAVGTLAEFSTMVRHFKTLGFSPVLCLDEFENLTKRPQEFTDDVFEGWRALGNAGQLAFVTVSQHPLSELIKSGGLTSNFDNIFSQLDLALLEETPARNLLAEPLARNQIAVHPDVRDDLLTFCGPTHPFYLQIAGFYLCDAMTNGAFTTERVKEDFTWEAERHWHGLWQALSPEEQLAFPVTWALAATPTAQTYCRILERKGLLLAENGGYKPFSEGFAQWVQKQMSPLTQPASERVAPAEPMPGEEDEEPEKPEPQMNHPAQLDWKILLLATFVTLLVLVVTAWVLKTLIGDQSTGNLILLLVVAFPFILVLVGKLTGQDLLAWFGQMLGRNKSE